MNFNKETILAAILGFSLGLTAAWLVFRLPGLINQEKKVSTLISQEETTIPRESFSLNLTSPGDETMATESQVKISGQTQAGATVVVAGPLADEVWQAGADGSFTGEVALEEGVNEITITAYSPDSQEEKTETRTITYTQEEF